MPELPKAFNHDNSMGLVRYYLAFAVFVAHFNAVYDAGIWFPTDSYNAVGGFFALSGFLVYPSYLKHRNLKDYMLRRVRRIFPPYMFIVLLCAFALVFVSTLPASEYFFNAQWLKYLASNLTFMNFLCPELPGVFQDLPVKAVNGSLWTMKVEILLYLSVPVAVALLTYIHRRARWFGPLLFCIMVYVVSAVWKWYFTELYYTTEKTIYNILSKQLFGQLLYFYGGVFVYFVYDRFDNCRHWVMVACVLIILVSDYVPYTLYRTCISPAVAVGLVMYFSTFRVADIFNKNNISYDIYLYHFPVILVLTTLFGGKGLPVWLVFVIAVACTVVLGMLSWFGIGRKFINR